MQWNLHKLQPLNKYYIILVLTNNKLNNTTAETLDLDTYASSSEYYGNPTLRLWATDLYKIKYLL